MSKLLEHLVASSFFNINYKRNISYKVYYDGKNKGKESWRKLFLGLNFQNIKLK